MVWYMSARCMLRAVFDSLPVGFACSGGAMRTAGENAMSRGVANANCRGSRNITGIGPGVQMAVDGNDVLAVDPDQITSLELIGGDDPDIELRIFLAGNEEPARFRFADVKGAIRCYEELWVARALRQRDAVKIR